IRDEHGQHSAEYRVGRDADQQNRHHKFEIADLETRERKTRFRKARDAYQELSADTQENAHVQKPAEHDDDASRPAHARAKLAFDKLRDRDNARIAERLYAKTGVADYQH